MKKEEKKRLELITHTGLEEQKLRQKKLLAPVERDLAHQDKEIKEKFNFSKKFENLEKLTGEGNEVLSQLTESDMRKKERNLALMGKGGRKKRKRKKKLDRQLKFLEEVYNGIFF